jgi:hypothetical protein
MDRCWGDGEELSQTGEALGATLGSALGSELDQCWA